MGDRPLTYQIRPPGENLFVHVGDSLEDDHGDHNTA